jgi:Xaa-Pro aminopeptidase
MDRMSLNSRKKRAADVARAAGVNALLVTHLPDVRWLCGFTGSSAALVMPCPSPGSSRKGTRALLFTDGRYIAQANAEAAGTQIVIATKPPLTEACEWIASARIKRCGFDRTQTTVASLDNMRKAVPAKLRRSLFVALDPLVARLRQIKDADEIAKLRAAAALGCKLFDHILTFIQPGMTEMAVAAELEHAARLAGAEGMSFETIIASGERSSRPHGHATTARLPKRGFVTLDFGVVLEGYCSDMTRTIHIGRASTPERAAYDAVLEAQQAGVAAVRAGVVTGDVDESCRSVLRHAGLAQWFTHSTGHSLGLEIHEEPRLAPKRTEKLKAGMIVTIEPGIYMPGKFGLRIEDTVLVTRSGCEILTPNPKAWIEL